MTATIHITTSTGRLSDVRIDPGTTLCDGLASWALVNNLDISKVVCDRKVLSMKEPVYHDMNIFCAVKPTLPEIVVDDKGPNDEKVKSMTTTMRSKKGLSTTEEPTPLQKRPLNNNSDIVRAILQSHAILDLAMFQDMLRVGVPRETEEPEDEDTTDEEREEELMELVQIPVDRVQQLIEFGFEELRAKRALLLNRLDANRAAEYLLECDVDTPLSRMQCTQLRRNYNITQQQIQQRRNRQSNSEEAAAPNHEEEAAPANPNDVESVLRAHLIDEDTDDADSNLEYEAATGATNFLMDMGFNPSVVADTIGLGDFETVLRALLANPNAITDQVALRNTLLNTLADTATDSEFDGQLYTQLMNVTDPEELTSLLTSPPVLAALSQAYTAAQQDG